MDDTGFRLKNFLKREGITQKGLALQLGIAPQYLNAICKGRKNVSKPMAARIEELTGVSAAWLLTGKGRMRPDELPSGADAAHDDGPAPVPDASPSGISLSDGSVNVGNTAVPMLNYAKGRPYYNVDFSLGFDTLVNDQTRTPDYLINFRPYNHCDCWCNAHGDSMHPTISSGDIVALKRIEDFRYLINGDIYAIVTTNGLRTIKRVRDNGDTLTLIPDNKEIAEQTVPKSIITHIYNVLGTIKMF